MNRESGTAGSVPVRCDGQGEHASVEHTPVGQGPDEVRVGPVEPDGHPRGRRPGPGTSLRCGVATGRGARSHRGVAAGTRTRCHPDRHGGRRACTCRARTRRADRRVRACDLRAGAGRVPPCRTGGRAAGGRVVAGCDCPCLPAVAVPESLGAHDRRRSPPRSVGTRPRRLWSRRIACCIRSSSSRHSDCSQRGGGDPSGSAVPGTLSLNSVPCVPPDVAATERHARAGRRARRPGGHSAATSCSSTGGMKARSHRSVWATWA